MDAADPDLTGHPRSVDSYRPTERFSDRATLYARVRPSYPTGAIDLVLEGLGDPRRLVAADVGAGTGISARLLADRGVRVLAVEPNREMRAAAAPHDRVEWREGTAEATGLPASSVDLVLCAQSFHWFDAPKALTEFHRVLRPAGRLVLTWNERDESDAFTSRYYDLVHAAAPEHRELPDPDPAEIASGGLFARPTLVEVPNRQVLDEDGLVERALSASYVPLSGPAHDRLLPALRDLHRRHRDAAGLASLRYRTRVWRSARLP